MLYRIEVGPRENLSDLPGAGVLAELKSIGAALPDAIHTARLYWLDVELDADAVAKLAHDLLADALVERVSVESPLYAGIGQHIEVIRKPGVMDPVLASIEKALNDREIQTRHIATGRKYVFDYDKNPSPDKTELLRLSRKLLGNESIEEIHIGRPAPVHAPGAEAIFKLVEGLLRGKGDEALLEISKKGSLSLSLPEMKAIQEHYAELGREPKDIELETIAQTWSEHCRHKTMRGPVDLDAPGGRRTYNRSEEHTS